MYEVEFAGFKCEAVLDYYDREEYRPRIRLFTKDGEPVATATVNIPSYQCPESDSAFIKNYSENEGMLDALVDARIVLMGEDGPIDVVNSGFVWIPLVQLNREWMDHITPNEYAGMDEVF
jgi:hypothetical protein